MAPEKVSAHDVFTVFENGGGWPTTTVSVFVGLISSVFATYGTDLPAKCNVSALELILLIT